MNAVYSKEDCSTRICAQAAADTYALLPPSGTRRGLQLPKLARAPRGLQQAGTCAQGPPYCAHWRRMPASCALYAPEAQGGYRRRRSATGGAGRLPEAQGGLSPRAARTLHVRATRASLGRAVRTAYRAQPGGHCCGRPG